jgi:hypothetical protein
MIGAAVSVILFFGVPISLLSISWFHLFRVRGNPGFFYAAVALVVLTSSYAIFIGSLWVPGILGPAYSNRRFLTISANVGVDVLVLLVAWWKNSPVWRWITVVALVLGPVWFLTLILNGVV